ncbi:MAG: pyridoxine 5'-phosphate synthase [Myxococcaceae bacterium]|nr:pyridoxine 5'-phosphate synthase [Myxococcaceae bacterium]MBH2006037.1 pyridoxine 5'-phosphate synthase [Myxococcaceae bacterium]
MTRLSVNINKIATLRNARGGDLPNLVQAALDIERFGAHGITVHPRPDERHIRIQDVYDLAQRVTTEFNIEGYPSNEYLNLIRNIRPQQATLVPDAPEVLTSHAGWDVRIHQDFLKHQIHQLKLSGARISLFIDPFDYQESTLTEIQDTGTDRVELYTERYARCFELPVREEVLGVYQRVAEAADRIGLGVNAGHDLNLKNLTYFLNEVGCVQEVSIGHALISDSLYFGLEQTVQSYLNCLDPAARISF